MAIYKLFKNSISEEVDSVTLTIDSNHRKSIPFAPGNTDYQEYLEWVAAGNTAEAAD
jgi:hypothetical protein